MSYINLDKMISEEDLNECKGTLFNGPWCIPEMKFSENCLFSKFILF